MQQKVKMKRLQEGSRQQVLKPPSQQLASSLLQERPRLPDKRQTALLLKLKEQNKALHRLIRRAGIA